ncbi:metallophosphoesterase [Nakamurella silvestris]|nr:metallophosphoesterase [Nakamurella silvestris]
MRIHVVSDIHGNMEALARAGEGADLLIVLGDLLDYVDYHDPAGGILGTIFGADRVAPFVAFRTSGQFGRLHEYNQQLWSTVADPHQAIAEIVAARYEQAVAVLGENTLLTLGNVDVAGVWEQVAPPRLRCLDGETVQVDGLTVGFVAGGSTRPGTSFIRSDSPWKPYVRSAADYTAAVERVGPVDILCSHIPPKLLGLRYDTVPARLEMYGPGLIETIDRHQPALALSGHVHQPLSQRVRRGRTECVNVGHFQRRESAYAFDTDRLQRAG